MKLHVIICKWGNGIELTIYHMMNFQLWKKMEHLFYSVGIVGFDDLIML